MYIAEQLCLKFKIKILNYNRKEKSCNTHKQSTSLSDIMQKLHLIELFTLIC